MSNDFGEIGIKLAQLKSRGGPLIEAQAHTANHRAEIALSNVAGCFYCCTTFSPDRIEDWLDEGDGTAMCPNCGIDSVIGDSSGFPVSDTEFLKQMHKVWFGL